MATTKKVAKSPVKAKRVLLTPKKVAKKSTVSAAKKKADKITIQNNTAKRTPTKASVPLVQKLEKVEALHTQKKQITSKNNTDKTVSTLRSQLSVALLSPYRFPVDIDKVAVGTARFGGVFFVIVGAFFTLLLAGPSLNSHAQLANSYVVPESLIEYEDNSGSDSGSSAGTTATGGATDTKPAAEFIVNNPDGISGSVQIKVKVANANKITLFGYYKTGGTDVTFGTPSKVSSDTWELYVDSRKFADGEYKLKALIINQYNGYEAVDSKYVTFTNSSSATQQNTQEASDVQEVTQAVLFVNKNESDSELRFEVTVRDADAVRVYAKNKAGIRKIIGYAYKADSTTWKYKWNLKEVVAGTYEVQAESEGNNDLTSNSVFVKVSNGVTAPAVNTVSTTTVAATPDEEENEEDVLAPEIEVSLDAHSPLSGSVTAKIEVEGAKSVIVNVLPKGSLVQRYLGTARKVDDEVWLYNWNTTATPNGEYQLFVYVENAYGTYIEETDVYSVQNNTEISYTEEQQKTIEKLIAVAESEEATKPYVAPLAPSSEDESVSEESEENESSNNTETLDELIEEYREEIEDELQRLASALRVKDENAVFEIKERLGKLKRQIVNAHVGNTAQDELIAMIDRYLEETVRRVEADVVRIEKVIETRTALQAQTDSDQDGISDYDEIALYGTDPYSADTDGDGYTDGSEILSGYNPLDAVSEVLVAYESPKETGIVRDDIFVIDSVVTATPDEVSPDAKAAALISGKGMPNSFVTLYVFSTPIVVTLKTDAQGNWNYRFDKEIEDGEHQVYVGVTDNAGKIVAKSKPFVFVKEAQAFNAVDTSIPEFTPEVPQTSLMSQYVIYLVLSISVVAIGLVLILLGVQLDARQRRVKGVLQSAEVSV